MKRNPASRQGESEREGGRAVLDIETGLAHTRRKTEQDAHITSAISYDKFCGTTDILNGSQFFGEVDGCIAGSKAKVIERFEHGASFQRNFHGSYMAAEDG